VRLERVHLTGTGIARRTLPRARPQTAGALLDCRRRGSARFVASRDDISRQRGRFIASASLMDSCAAWGRGATGVSTEMSENRTSSHFL
jgi:hypothetical protein